MLYFYGSSPDTASIRFSDSSSESHASSMLQNTFIHLPGISLRKERLLWQQEILNWEDLEKAYPHLGNMRQRTLFSEKDISSEKQKETLSSVLEASFEALAKGDVDFFAKRLPPREQYRIALSFPETTAFLDIETTGLSHYYDVTTVVGVSMGDEYLPYIRGTSRKPIRDFLSRANCLVTFNGKIFDTRFIRNEFPEFHLPAAHVDLRFFSRRVGLSGGQKAIEQEINIKREKNVVEISGEKAPLLWHEYRLGSITSAKALIKYNHADVEGMKFILDEVLDRIWKEEPELSVFNRHRFSDSESKFTWASKKETVKRNRVFIPKFRGRRGPQITYKDLTGDNASRSLRIVGIDLTGSEKRPTGWCLLDGDKAYTRLLSTDKDLIRETLQTNPHLVSIDSPLSMPEGRTRVSDDDPVRDKYGIMRKCERELKRRGVNVYPSLIPSMQRLTARGMELAAHFRKVGVPVIESYPGAAQDIMGIPRKRAGLQYLKQGLADFGVSGNFQIEDVVHDELDAITSAIVGLFFWSGKFEALGNPAEEYLIIPDLDKSAELWKARSVIGISGHIASGKTTAAEYFKSKGFNYGRFSQVLADILSKKGKPTDRDSLQKFGEKIHKNPGQRWLCKQLSDFLPEEGNLVIDGLRFPEDHAFMVEEFGPAFIHVHIDTPQEIRKHRYMKLGHSAKAFSVAENHTVETEIHLLATHAHETVENNKTIPPFKSKIGRAIKKKKT